VALPGGGDLRPAGAHVWAPDVAATIAALGGVTLDGSPGVDLRREPAADRTTFAWSRAPREQLGWE
jgi:hypothetical protein